MSELKVPEILEPAIRQYRRTCNDDIVAAFHYEKTKEVVLRQQARIDELEKIRSRLCSALSLTRRNVKDLEEVVECQENQLLFGDEALKND